MKNIEYFLKRGCGRCPECGSEDTGESTYADWCNDCDWYFGY